MAFFTINKKQINQQTSVIWLRESPAEIDRQRDRQTEYGKILLSASMHQHNYSSCYCCESAIYLHCYDVL